MLPEPALLTEPPSNETSHSVLKSTTLTSSVVVHSEAPSHPVVGLVLAGPSSLKYSMVCTWGSDTPCVMVSSSDLPNHPVV